MKWKTPNTKNIEGKGDGWEPPSKKDASLKESKGKQAAGTLHEERINRTIEAMLVLPIECMECESPYHGTPIFSNQTCCKPTPVGGPPCFLFPLAQQKPSGESKNCKPELEVTDGSTQGHPNTSDAPNRKEPQLLDPNVTGPGVQAR